MAYETGISSLVAFVVLIVYLGIRLSILTIRINDPIARRWLKGMLLSLIGIVAHFMTEPLYHNIVPWVYFGLITSAIVVHERMNPDAYKE